MFDAATSWRILQTKFPSKMLFCTLLVIFSLPSVVHNLMGVHKREGLELTGTNSTLHLTATREEQRLHLKRFFWFFAFFSSQLVPFGPSHLLRRGPPLELPEIAELSFVALAKQLANRKQSLLVANHYFVPVLATSPNPEEWPRSPCMMVN